MFKCNTGEYGLIAGSFIVKGVVFCFLVLVGHSMLWPTPCNGRIHGSSPTNIVVSKRLVSALCQPLGDHGRSVSESKDWGIKVGFVDATIGLADPDTDLER